MTDYRLLTIFHSPATCRTNLPNGRHSASTFPKSSAVKSGPAFVALPPFRLTCITPTTFPSQRIGALMIFWIDSPVVVAAFTPSNTVAWRTAAKSLLISGRLSLTVRAARADLLVNGMNPTFFNAGGTRKCRCRHRCDTPNIATSSGFTRNSLAIFSASASSDTSFKLVSSASSELARGCSSDTKVVPMAKLHLQERAGGARGPA